LYSLLSQETIRSLSFPSQRMRGCNRSRTLSDLLSRDHPSSFRQGITDLLLLPLFLCFLTCSPLLKLAPDLTLAVLADKKIDYSKIQLQNKIDEGSFANVHRGTFNGLEVAVKELKLEDSEIAEFRREIWLMRYSISLSRSLNLLSFSQICSINFLILTFLSLLLHSVVSTIKTL
jgi:hypothetical protein